MKPDVREAIDELARAFPGHLIDEIEEEQGGAWVVVHDLDLGEHFLPRRAWIGFGIQFQYPYTDVYPHFLPAELTRAAGSPVAVPFQPNQVMPGTGQSSTMLSRRSTNWNPATDTAALKLQRILDFLRRGAA